MPEEVLEAWRAVWRRGIAPQLSTKGLLCLKTALQTDDPALIQGATTTPPALQCVQDWPVQAACLIGYPGWKGDGLVTVAQVEERFADLCEKADEAIGEPAACRWLMNFFDDTPREEMRRKLLEEVQLEIGRRLPLYLRRDPVLNPESTTEVT